MKRIFILFTALSVFTAAYAEGVHSKAYEKRVEMIGYLRAIEPMVRNYPGKDKEGNETTIRAKGDKKGQRYNRYEEIKRVFQEGLLYYFEGSYVNAYRRFLESQLTMEQLLEELSQEYVDKTEDMLKASVDRKDENKSTDKSLMDITVEFGANTKMRRDQLEPRESSKIARKYDPKEYHYVLNKSAIEENIANGYQALGQAKTARINALKIEKTLERHQKLDPKHRKYRIEQYMASIYKCRDARANAVNVFRLKYPLDNYYLLKDQDEELEKVKMNYSQNYYVNRKNLAPVFDKSIPEQFRRHATDVNGYVYEDSIDEKVKLKFDAPGRKLLGVPEETPDNSSPSNTNDTPPVD